MARGKGGRLRGKACGGHSTVMEGPRGGSRDAPMLGAERRQLQRIAATGDGGSPLGDSPVSTPAGMVRAEGGDKEIEGIEMVVSSKERTTREMDRFEEGDGDEDFEGDEEKGGNKNDINDSVDGNHDVDGGGEGMEGDDEIGGAEPSEEAQQSIRSYVQRKVNIPYFNQLLAEYLVDAVHAFRTVERPTGLLDFVELGADHTADVIAETFEKVVVEWGLAGRVFAETTDNAESNVKAFLELANRGGTSGNGISLLGAKMHFRAVQQPQNQGATAAEKARFKELRLSDEDWAVLEELLKFLEPFDTITQVVEGSLYVTVSSMVPHYNDILDVLEGMYHNLVVRPSNLLKACIEAALPKLKQYYYGSIDELVVATFLDPQYKLSYFELPPWEAEHQELAAVVAEKARFKELRLSDEDWAVLEELLKFLEPFDTITQVVEGSLYVTVSSMVPHYNDILDVLEGMYHNLVVRPSNLLKACIEAALPKLKQYYYGSIDELVVATFLDPQYKLSYFELPPWEAEHQELAAVVDRIRATMTLKTWIASPGGEELLETPTKTPTNSVVESDDVE
ncbi:unnamed protein product [Closterium sp. Naga37s-1]|nr:unnamed protein product [Closterium sp. Naga37s-1]